MLFFWLGINTHTEIFFLPFHEGFSPGSSHTFKSIHANTDGTPLQLVADCFCLNFQGENYLNNILYSINILKLKV